MGKLSTQTYQEIYSEKTPFEYLRGKLKLKSLEAQRNLKEKHGAAIGFLKDKGLEISKLREHSAKVLGAGAVAGAVLISSPQDLKSLPPPQEVIEKLRPKSQFFEMQNPHSLVVNTLSSTLPEKTRPLTRMEEKFLEQIFQNLMHVNTKATLEGEHLNTTYGRIGAEQHLRRYPGDTIGEHSEEAGILDYSKNEVLNEGMAPGLGAWGYFARSRGELTKEAIEREKWYAVVQTLYLPDWNTRQPYLKNWYKYRKVLVVNTENGNAVVASIADSGPAAWTGKHFGGSPEVMLHLGGPKYKKGPVIVFFVDDPNNKVPLGPVVYDKINMEDVSFKEI